MHAGKGLIQRAYGTGERNEHDSRQGRKSSLHEGNRKEEECIGKMKYFIVYAVKGDKATFRRSSQS